MQKHKFRILVASFISIIIVELIFLFSITNLSTIGSVFVENGIIINDATNKPYTGKVIDTLQSKIVSYEVKEGIKNGEFIISLLDGSKLVNGNIINNKNEGKWSYYYPDGQLESEGFFKNDIVVDKWCWYYLNGNKSEEGIYVDGKRDGIWKMYNKDGSLKSSILFKEGNVIKSIETESSAAVYSP